LDATEDDMKTDEELAALYRASQSRLLALRAWYDEAVKTPGLAEDFGVRLGAPTPEMLEKDRLRERLWMAFPQLESAWREMGPHDYGARPAELPFNVERFTARRQRESVARLAPLLAARRAKAAPNSVWAEAPGELERLRTEVENAHARIAELEAACVALAGGEAYLAAGTWKNCAAETPGVREYRPAPQTREGFEDFPRNECEVALGGLTITRAT
jgi:hypothetical protein